jgi:hypothetical protein
MTKLSNCILCVFVLMALSSCISQKELFYNVNPDRYDLIIDSLCNNLDNKCKGLSHAKTVTDEKRISCAIESSIFISFINYLEKEIQNKISNTSPDSIDILKVYFVKSVYKFLESTILYKYGYCRDFGDGCPFYKDYWQYKFLDLYESFDERIIKLNAKENSWYQLFLELKQKKKY